VIPSLHERYQLDDKTVTTHDKIEVLERSYVQSDRERLASSAASADRLSISSQQVACSSANILVYVREASTQAALPRNGGLDP